MLELYVYQEQYFFFFFFNDTATTEIYTLSLHDALPISFSIGRCCPMLIPLRHENMEGRRWPVVTFALIALNLLIFLGTHWKIEAQEPERLKVRTHVLVLAATHPDLKMPEDVQMFVNEVQSKKIGRASCRER